MNSNNRPCLSVPTAQRGYWRTFLVSIFGLVLVFASARADSPSPTPVASPATPNPTPEGAPEGRVSLEAVARKRLPNTVADIGLGIRVEGRTTDAVSNGLAQPSPALLDDL